MDAKLRKVVARVEAAMFARMADDELRKFAGPDDYDLSSLTDAELRLIAAGYAPPDVIAKIERQPPSASRQTLRISTSSFHAKAATRK
jgi:hypothetical protein